MNKNNDQNMIKNTKQKQNGTKIEIMNGNKRKYMIRDNNGHRNKNKKWNWNGFVNKKGIIQL